MINSKTTIAEKYCFVWNNNSSIYSNNKSDCNLTAGLFPDEVMLWIKKWF